MARAKIVRTTARLGFGLLNSALDSGVIAGHSDYTRFIILGTARTGSTFLLTALQAHSRIRAYGELLRLWKDEDFPKWPHRFGPLTRRRVVEIRADPNVYLRKHLFRKYPRQVSAVGFKIFYRHAQAPRWKPIWAYLEGEKDIRVLHLKRANLLRRFLSLEVARTTGRYRADPAGKSIDVPAVTIDYDDLRQAFTRMQAEECEFDARFADHRLLNVVYERLTTDTEVEMRRIQEFLDLEWEPVRASTRKQGTRPLAAAIANYYQLKDAFRGTPWAHCFDE